MDRHHGRRARHALPEVQNPILALPATVRLLQIDPPTLALLRDVLLDLAVDARTRAEKSWSRNKSPMAAYWKAVSVYAAHLARVLR